jgi:hypothetical protein
MSAKLRVRPPSSSREANTGLAVRSPAATWRTPSASSSSGRTSWLPSSDGQQHRAKDRQDQRQRQRADVHAAQAVARQRALLVLAVGGLHRQRIGGQARGRGCTTSRKRSSPALERDLVLGSRASARTCGRPPAGGQRSSSRPSIWLAHAAGARLAQQGAPGRSGAMTVGAAAGAEQHLPVGVDQRPRGAELLAQPLQRQRLHRVAPSARRSAAWRVLSARSSTSVSSVPLPSARPASSAPATRTSNQASMLRETNW